MTDTLNQPSSALFASSHAVAGRNGSNPCHIERIEQKYAVLLRGERLSSLLRTVSRFIPLHEYIPGHGITWTKSLYFDSDSRDLWHHQPDSLGKNTQVRLRTYNYEDCEAAPDYWMEAKIKNGHVTKLRFRLREEVLDRFLAGQDVEHIVIADNRMAADPATIRHSYQTVRQLLEAHQLKPALLVSYKRVAFQNNYERLSFDWDLGYFQVNSDIHQGNPFHGVVDTPIGCEPRTLLEIKYPDGEFPGWMRRLQRLCQMEELKDFSKFERGMERLETQLQVRH